jgi:cobalt-zinc-cadmium resistance protein CzcA
VNSWGGAQRTLDVIADPARSSARGLTLEVLREDCARRPVAREAGGRFPFGRNGQVLVRAQARPSSGRANSARRRGRRGGARGPTWARCVEGSELRLGAATANGQGETLYLMAQMLRDANALEVMDRLHARMPQVQRGAALTTCASTSSTTAPRW